MMMMNDENDLMTLSIVIQRVLFCEVLGWRGERGRVFEEQKGAKTLDFFRRKKKLLLGWLKKKSLRVESHSPKFR